MKYFISILFIIISVYCYGQNDSIYFSIDTTTKLQNNKIEFHDRNNDFSIPVIKQQDDDINTRSEIVLLATTLICLSPMDDNSKHYYAGAGISYVSGSIFYKKTKRKMLSCMVGMSMGALAGLTKEYYYDKHMGKGVFSKDDYQITSWGSVCGGFTLCLVIDSKQRNQHKYGK